MRDWISVDQALRRALDKAADEQERQAIRLAAETSLGPDPDVLGGGPEWQAALGRARESLRFAVADDLESCARDDLAVDQYALVHELRGVLEKAGVSQVVLARFASVLEQRVTQAVDQTRLAERATVAAWLRKRSAESEAGAVLLVAAQRLETAAGKPST